MKPKGQRTSRPATVQYKRKPQKIKSDDELKLEKASLRTYYRGGGDDIA